MDRMEMSGEMDGVNEQKKNKQSGRCQEEARVVRA
jgi:hypothetical protein